MKKPASKKIKEALEKNSGILTKAAEDLGCSRRWLKIWIDGDIELSAFYIDCKEAIKDMAEAQLIKNILEGKEASLLFYMKAKMKDRGYVDLKDMSLTIDAVKVNYIVPVMDEKIIEKV